MVYGLGWCLIARDHEKKEHDRAEHFLSSIQGCRFGLLNLMVHGSGLRVQGSGFRVEGRGFRARGSGLRVQGSGFRVQGSGFRVRV